MSRWKQAIQRALPEKAVLHLQAVDQLWRGERELRLLSRVCPPGRAAVDVGANIGIYSYFLRRCASRVHAYEPNPGLAQRLQRLLPSVTVRNCAVSDAPGVLTLRIPVSGGRVAHELASVAQSFADSAETVTFEVPAVTLDSEDLADVGFLKIDAEQHELAVLRGSAAMIARCRPTIMCEVTPLLYPRPLPQTFEFLTSSGYEGWFFFADRYLPFAQFRQETHANPDLWGKVFMGGNVFFFPPGVAGAAALSG